VAAESITITERVELHVHTYLLRTSAVLALAVSAFAGPQDRSLPALVAKACGADSFAAVEQLRFTFNVQSGETHTSRAWVWDVRNGQVSLQAGGGLGVPVTYRRSDLSSSSTDTIRKVDAWFVNDQYWLLFPLHLVWDTGTSISVEKGVRLPYGEGLAARITVAYPSSGGYTPGDAYDLYVDERYRVVQWVYHRAGVASATRAARWEDYRRVGPLLLSLDRPGTSGDFRVWFTDVALKTAGSHP
jgi:hypothetical protein